MIMTIVSGVVGAFLTYKAAQVVIASVKAEKKARAEDPAAWAKAGTSWKTKTLSVAVAAAGMYFAAGMCFASAGVLFVTASILYLAAVASRAMRATRSSFSVGNFAHFARHQQQDQLFAQQQQADMAAAIAAA